MRAFGYPLLATRCTSTVLRSSVPYLAARRSVAFHSTRQPNDRANAGRAYSSKSPAHPVHENIYTVPNILTFTRLACAPAVGYLIFHDYHIAALSLFVYAGVTDCIDGWIARRWKSGTVLGTIIDPMADKALMTIVTVVLATKHILPVPLAVLILGRDILLSFSAFYYRYVSLPPPRTLGRYWDFSLPSAEVKPTTISKINTLLQLLLIGASMTGAALGGPTADLSVGLGESGSNLLHVGWWIVAGTTIWSGLSYVGGRRGLRILRPPRP